MAEKSEEVSALDRALDEMLKLKGCHGDVRLMIGKLDGKVPSPVGSIPVTFIALTAVVPDRMSVEDRHELHLGVAAVFLGFAGNSGRGPGLREQLDWSLVIVDAGPTTAAEVLASHLGGDGG